MKAFRLAGTLFVVAFLCPALQAASFLAIPLRTDPPQQVGAIVLQAGESARACEVRNGAIMVPSDLPLPWTVAQLRFEPTSYTREDLKRRAPLVLRELGQIRLRLRPMPAAAETVRAQVLRNGEKSPFEVLLTKDDQNGLRGALASGTYAAAFVGDVRGTRIRSGIVVAPGQTTELGELAFEPSASVTLRVVDGKSTEPVANAQVMWSPPDALNAEVAHILYGRLWSSTTNREGIVTIRSIGPPPIPARWMVKADGYAPTLTSRTLITDTRNVALPDTRLRPETVLVIDVALPKPSDEFRGASLVLGEPESDATPRYRPASRQPLVDGENRLKLTSLGRKRISIQDRLGKTLFYRDLDLQPDDLRMTIAPLPTRISGVVRTPEGPLEGALVTAADGKDARTIHAKVTTDRTGGYALSIYQSGRVLIYATGPRGSEGASSGAVLKDIVLSGEPERTLDLELPSAGAEFRVIDAENRLPLRARIHGRLTQRDGSSSGVFAETDSAGKGTITRMAEGSAKLVVRANGYRAHEVEVEIRTDVPEYTVALSKGGRISGRVVDRHGAPIPNAQILGGFPEPFAPQGRFATTTDPAGRFDFEDNPEPGTMFYVAAQGYALGTTLLRENVDNIVTLSPPNAGALALVAGHGPPKKLSLLMPGIPGGEIIPWEVFRTLALLNGMSPFQLMSSGAEGTLIFPEFLPAGTWTLYLVRTERRVTHFDRVSDIVVPARPGTVISIPE